MIIRALSITMILLFVLSACAAPAAQPLIETPAPTPVVTVLPPVDTPLPLPTAMPPAPTPTTLAESGAASASGQEAIASAAVATAAKALGVEPGTVRLVSVEAVQWPDSCLGVNLTDQACLEAITPGFRALVEVDGATYAVHTNQDGSVVRFAGPAETTTAGLAPGYLGMEWRSPGEPCQASAISMNSVIFGPCNAAPQEVPLASQERQDDLATYISLYASFEADTPAGALRFTGAGPAVATSAAAR